MKKEDLIQIRDKMNRAVIWFFALVFTGLVAFMLLSTVIPDALKWQANVILAIYAITSLWVIIRISNRFDVKCPHCLRSLQGGVLISLALTTGKCGHCGERVLEE